MSTFRSCIDCGAFKDNHKGQGRCRRFAPRPTIQPWVTDVDPFELPAVWPAVSDCNGDGCYDSVPIEVEY